MRVNKWLTIIRRVHVPAHTSPGLMCVNFFVTDDHSNVPVGVPESSNWCGYSTSSYSPNAAPLGGGYAAYPDAAGPTAAAMDAPSASEFIICHIVIRSKRFRSLLGNAHFEKCLNLLLNDVHVLHTSTRKRRLHNLLRTCREGGLEVI